MTQPSLIESVYALLDLSGSIISVKKRFLSLSNFCYLRLLAFVLCLLTFAFLLTPAHASAPLFQTYTQRDGLAEDFVTSIAFEPGGAAWVGTSNGATRVQDKYWFTYTAANGLGNSWVTGITIAPDGKVYFATYGGGLTVFSGSARKTHNLSNSAIPSNFLTSIARDKQNRVWVGTFGAGVGRLDGEQWTKFSLADNYVNAIAVDANNNPWVATNVGAFYFNGAAWARFTQDNGLGSNRVNAVAVGPDGRVWFGTDSGATVWDGRSFRTFRERDGLTSDSIRTIAFGDQNRVWLGTARGITEFEEPGLKKFSRDEGLADNLVLAIAIDAQNNAWVGTPHGLSVMGVTLQKPATYPIVLVHGWHGPDSDQLDDSEFRFLRKYLEADGMQGFYAAGISPYRTLLQNAATLHDVIADAKKKTGAGKVDLIAFSMGGLNARAYLESSLYENDVRRAIILGTPMAGVRLWYPLLTREIEDRPTEPSAIELSPEYAALFNQTHAPRPTVPYDLLTGDARTQNEVDLLKIFPPSDGLIETWSAHALDAPNVRHIADADLHAWNPTPLYFEPTSYLYPAQTYERYLRNALRDPDARPIGFTASPVEPIPPRNITPMNADTLRAGETITRAVVIDANRAARFFARWDRGDVNMELRAPDGTRYAAANYRDATYLKADIGSFIGYAIPRAQPGAWQIIATRADTSRDPLKLTTYADLDADLQISASSDQLWYRPSTRVTITATLSNRAGGADVRARVQWLGDGVSPRGEATEFKFDDRGSGSYQLPITGLNRGGYYLARITARAPGLERERELIFSIAPASARFEGTPSARVEGSQGSYSALVIESSVNVSRPGGFALAVTIRARGQVVASVTAPIALQAGVQKVSVPIPGRDIRAQGVDAPYTVDLTLMDATWAAVQIDALEKILTINEYRANDFT